MAIPYEKLIRFTLWTQIDRTIFPSCPSACRELRDRLRGKPTRGRINILVEKTHAKRVAKFNQVLRKLNLRLIVAPPLKFQELIRTLRPETLFRREKGKLAVLNGKIAERKFREWCVENGFYYLTIKHLLFALCRSELPGDRKYWTKVKSIIKMIPESKLRVISKFEEKVGMGPYGNVKGMPDFLVVSRKFKKLFFFVEVKAGRRRPSAAQVQAIDYFSNRGIETGLFQADLNTIDMFWQLPHQ